MAIIPIPIDKMGNEMSFLWNYFTFNKKESAREGRRCDENKSNSENKWDIGLPLFAWSPLLLPLDILVWFLISPCVKQWRKWNDNCDFGLSHFLYSCCFLLHSLLLMGAFRQSILELHIVIMIISIQLLWLLRDLNSENKYSQSLRQSSTFF